MGVLEVVLGPMFSGKSSYMINKANEIKKNSKILFISHKISERKDNNSIYSRNNDKIEDVIFLDSFNDFKVENIEEISSIFIDECQFFDLSIIHFVNQLINYTFCNIYCSGLLTDFKNEPFGYMYLLLTSAKNIKNIKSKCSLCTKDGIYTMRKSSDKQQIVTGDDKYISSCYNCYYKPFNE